jgi:hypothetical protein
MAVATVTVRPASTWPAGRTEMTVPAARCPSGTQTTLGRRPAQRRIGRPPHLARPAGGDPVLQPVPACQQHPVARHNHPPLPLLHWSAAASRPGHHGGTARRRDRAPA